MEEWSQISYREFWDYPRAVIAVRDGKTYFFDSRFDEALDGYIDRYEVWLLPPLPPDVLKGSWLGLEKHAIERLPDIGLRELPFQIPRGLISNHDKSGN